jgi:hypothetical protein
MSKPHSYDVSKAHLYDDDSYISVKEHSITYSAYMKKKLGTKIPMNQLYNNEPAEETIADYNLSHHHEPLLVE